MSHGSTAASTTKMPMATGTLTYPAAEYNPNRMSATMRPLRIAIGLPW
jgi:hypothetical protein